MLAARCRQLVVVGVQFDGTRVHEVFRRVVEGEAAHVERPEIERRPPFEHPFGHHLPRAPAGGNAVQESGRHVEVVEFRCPPHDEIGVRRIRDRSVDQHADTSGVDHRGPLRRECGELLETVEVRVEQLMLERHGDAGFAERQRIRFVPTDEQAGTIGFVVDEMIGVAHRRHLAQLRLWHRLDRTGDHVLVLDGECRNACTDQAADLQTPHPSCIDEHLALDDLLAAYFMDRLDMRRSTAVDVDRNDPGVLDDRRVARPRTSGDRLCHARRIDVSVCGQERRCEHVLRRHQREEFLRPVRRNDLHRQPEALGHRRQPLQFHHPLGRTRKAQAADLVPVDGLAGFRFQPAVHLDRLLQHSSRVTRRPQLPDEAGGMPGGTVGEPVLFDEDDVALAHLRQVIGDTASEDAAADDDDSRPCRQARGVARLLCHRERQ